MHKERPLSPHLQVYNMMQITSLLSVLHRGTGIFLSIGTPVLVYWLWTIAAGAETYHEFQQCASHWFARLCLFGWSFALFYHLCNGIRHLMWDIGKGFEISSVYRSGYSVVIVSTLLTIATWVIAYGQRGGL